MKAFQLGFSCAAILVFAAFTSTANAQEKELTPVMPSATFEKSCGQLFAITTFGAGANSPTFLFYRIAGSEKNDVAPSVKTAVEIKNIPNPVVAVEDAATRVYVFRMSAAAWEEAKECLPKPRK